MNATVPRWVRWLPKARLGLLSLFVTTILSGAVYVYEGMDSSWAWSIAVVRNGPVLDVIELRTPAGYEAIAPRTHEAPKEVYQLFLYPTGRPAPPFVCRARTPQASISVHYSGLASPVSQAERDEVQTAVALWSEVGADRKHVPRPSSVDEVVPARVAWNLAMLLLIVTVPLSIVRFVYETRAAARERVWIERLQRGVCPRCEYSIAGLSSESCPECGEFIPRDAIPAADAAKTPVSVLGEKHGHEDVSVARQEKRIGGDRRATQGGAAGSDDGA